MQAIDISPNASTANSDQVDKKHRCGAQESWEYVTVGTYGEYELSPVYV